MKRLLFLVLVVMASPVAAQRYKSDKSSVTFFSEAAVENITATNENSTGLFNALTGEIAFIVPISDFEFEKSLMKEHFNEKYMESDKFPRATFKGKITGYDLSLASMQPVIAKGVLTIHGETKEVNLEGSIQNTNGKITMKAVFIVELADYKIKIPKLLWSNIAERVEVTTVFTFKQL